MVWIGNVHGLNPQNSTNAVNAVNRMCDIDLN